MTAKLPARYEVLNWAEGVIDQCLSGNAEDGELRRLITFLRAREKEQATIAQIKSTWERTKMSPFFKLGLFYVALFTLSICANLIQKKLEKRLKA